MENKVQNRWGIVGYSILMTGPCLLPPDINAVKMPLCFKHKTSRFVFRCCGYDPGPLQPSG